MWAGVDVGGRRKGFHAAVVDEQELVAGPERLPSVADVVVWVDRMRPSLVAVDSPRAVAPPGSRSRECERRLAREVCGIRYTPEAERLWRNPYYEWIVHGLELYAALDAAGFDAIECFPTASFTRWAGPRGSRSRASWTSTVLRSYASLRLNQDERDAIAAALTARQHSLGATEEFGEIVVPRA